RRILDILDAVMGLEAHAIAVRDRDDRHRSTATLRRNACERVKDFLVWSIEEVVFRERGETLVLTRGSRRFLHIGTLPRFVLTKASTPARGRALRTSGGVIHARRACPIAYATWLSWAEPWASES